MLDSNFVSMVSSNSVFNNYNLSDSAYSGNYSNYSNLLTNSKTNYTSSSDFTNKIISIAQADAKADLEVNAQKNWQKSNEYLDLKDEYISSTGRESKRVASYVANNSISKIMSDAIGSFSTSNSFISTINQVFADAMNAKNARKVREVNFNFKYNQAYNAYKAGIAMKSSFDQMIEPPVLDVSV